MPNTGLNFAQAQLEKYGWSEGKGLGREEGGITEAIKPKLKFNSTGLGYDMGEQFKFHWWDHVFNKAADNIAVGKDENGSVQLKHMESLEVSTKRPSVNNTKSKFYGGFVKGGTLMGQDESAESDSSDEEQEKDRSLRLSDEQLFKICKGRTAHKGARHGLNMTAKLARVREQELLLMQELGAADQQVQEDNDQPQPKKKKKKSSKSKDVQTVMCAVESEPKSTVEYTKKKKNKRKGVLEQEGSDECVSEHKQEACESNPLKKKKKKRKTEVTDPCITEVCVTTKQKKKKKKKKEKNECATTLP